MKVFDSHTHIYPEKIASKAVDNIGDYYSIPMKHKGYAKDLLKAGREFNVKKFIVSSTATSPAQVESINNFIADEVKLHSEFVGLGTLHQDYINIDKEIDRLMSLGLKGIKLHPEFQNFNIDSIKMKRIYRAIEGKLVLLIHMGDKNKDSSSPQRLSKVIDEFPGLIIIAAHLGGFSKWDQAEEHLIGKNIYIDTSSSLSFLSPKQATSIIKKHGTDKVLFGTDYPMWNYKEELDRFNCLDIDTYEKEQILWNNAAKLFNI